MIMVKWDETEFVECFPSMHKELGSVPIMV